MNDIDRLMEEVWRRGSNGNERGRQLLRGYRTQLHELKGQISELESFIRGVERDSVTDFGDLPDIEERNGDMLFRFLHAAQTEVQNFKVAIIAWYTDRRGGV